MQQVMEIDVIEPFYYYHIYNRGINRQPIFFDNSHYYKFLDLCEKYIPCHADILAYCLIPNHFHLLVYIGPDWEKTIQKFVNNPFSNWFNAYAQFFNKSTGRTGTLFQRPFKRKRITSQNYLLQVIHYIHKNPIHHNLVENIDQYHFSSYKALAGTNPTFINRDHVYNWFSSPTDFADFHKINLEVEESEFFDD
jgi:REP element-mobilizing transposase RayT